MDLPYTIDELRSACFDLVGVNGLRECYLRPICLSGYGELVVTATDNPVDCAILAWPWSSLLGEQGLRDGIDLRTSSWQRVGSSVVPHAAKVTGIYLNSILALEEARRAGCHVALLLTEGGYVADGSAENVFVVAGGAISTPPLELSILPGVTRATVIELGRELGYSVEERHLIRSDLSLADELFVSGTAAEVTPVRTYDGVELGVGPITRELQAAFFDLVHGRRGHDEWLERVPVGAPAAGGSR
jgi:branched-chain amino acid aminotransferase